MNYSLLSDQELHERALQSATEEKSATLKLLEHLAEIDSRMMYAKRGYSSLWEYVHLALGYSESQSSERVSAMRLMRKVPEVKTAIEQGSMTLTSTLKLATFVKREKPAPDATVAILKECEGKSTRQVEKILISKAVRPETLPFSPHSEKITLLEEDRYRIQFTADEELVQLLERMKQLHSRSPDTGTEIKEVLKTALREYVQKRETKIPKQSKSQNRKKIASLQAPEKDRSLRAPEVASGEKSRFIPAGLKARIRVRSNDQCEFVDPVSGRRCSQRRFLEFDHKIPFAKGGPHTFENLRHYCRVHNQVHAIGTYGKRKMESFLRR